MGLSAKLLQLYRQLLTSYWCIPAAFLLASVALAAITVGIDQNYETRIVSDVFGFRPIETDTARVLLSMIAGSIIGVAGVVFSITMVAVSFASGTFGPRLIGNLMRDRGSQVSLGFFIGTFIYSLIILRFVQGGALQASESMLAPAFIPHVSIGTSIGLAICCMGVLIYFIHHVPETINIERIIANLGRALKAGIETRFPEQSDDRVALRTESERWIESADKDDVMQVVLDTNGYIQALDVRTLVKLAEKHDLHIEIIRRPGAFVTAGRPVLSIWADKSLDAKVCRSLKTCFATGISPTVNQNIEFIADQLVEIIARALSPGVNDPFTAITCVNWLQVGILHFVAHESLSDSFNQSDRVYSNPFLFKDFVTAVFKKAIPYIVTDRNVLKHTLDVLSSIADTLPVGGNRDVIEQTISDLKVSSTS